MATPATTIWRAAAGAMCCAAAIVPSLATDLPFARAADAIARQAHPGLCVVLESTTYPGTTRELLQPRLPEQGIT
jgi:UDP-N-acetyl-D-mannosaminuronate dehydrogenase